MLKEIRCWSVTVQFNIIIDSFEHIGEKIGTDFISSGKEN